MIITSIYGNQKQYWFSTGEVFLILNGIVVTIWDPYLVNNESGRARDYHVSKRRYDKLLADMKNTCGRECTQKKFDDFEEGFC